MIKDPEQMTELIKLRSKVLRLYGMGYLTMGQHLNALYLLNLFATVIKDDTFEVDRDVTVSTTTPEGELAV